MAMRQSLLNARFLLLLLFVLICILAHAPVIHAAALPSNATFPIVSVRDTAHFDQLISNANYTFIKFFHPRCPHCKALKSPFQSLSLLVQSYNQNTSTPHASRVTLAEVDASAKATEPLVRKYSPSGFPTLKLYRNHVFVAEFFGSRTVSDMFDFLVTSASVVSVPLITHIRSTAQLHSFVQTMADRPLVLSVSPPSEQFVRTATKMRSSLSPTTAFATVSHPSMLIPNQSDPLIRQLLSRYARLPQLAATASASYFSSSLNWWFADVRDSQSISSFMYTSIRQPQEPIQLSADDAPLVLQSEQPMLLAFGASDSPSWDDIFFLAHADVEAPSLIPVYMHVSKFVDFAQYVTLDVSDLNITQSDRHQAVANWSTQYVVYRPGNLNPFISKFGDTVNITGATWLYQQRKIINQTSVYTVAAEVNVLDHIQLQSLVAYDARGILLLLYNDDCAKCNTYASYITDVATRLEHHAGFIVVAAINVQNGLPSLPEVKGMDELPPQIPLLIWLSAGERVDVYDGVMSVNAISRYARQRAGVMTEFEDGLEWSDVMHAYVLLIGLVMMVVGILVSRRRQQRSVKRYHVT